MIVGPTASGKSGLALELARRHPGVELLSVDSMGVYRGMDVGTAKPSPAERAEVAYHGLDLADPAEEFTVARYQQVARAALTGIESRGHAAILVGGTGLYLRSVLDPLTIPPRWPALAAELEAEADRPGGVPSLHARLAGLDPLAASRMQPTNRRRVVRALEVTLGSGRPFSSYGPGLTSYPRLPGVRMVGLDLAAEPLAARIDRRVGDQLAAGWLEEVRALASRPEGLSRTARQALGYRELLGHVEDGIPMDAAVAQTIRRTRAFARRQRAWFRRDPRITWIDPGQNAVDATEAVLGEWGTWRSCS